MSHPSPESVVLQFVKRRILMDTIGLLQQLGAL